MEYRVTTQISFKNKVARRIFSMFCFCSLVPLLVISAVSFFYVGSQLKVQAHKRLHQQCKSQGFLIYEHLISLENEIALFTHDYPQSNFIQTRKPYNPNTREGSGLERIFFLRPDGTIQSPSGEVQDLPPQTLGPLFNSDNEQVLFTAKGEKDIFPRIFMKYRLDRERPTKGWVVAQINPLYLYGIGTEGAISPDVNMQIRQLDGTVLISSIPVNNLDQGFKAAFATNAATGIFESFDNGKSFLNSYWSIFLRHRFGSPDWVIVFSQSRASILSPFFRFAHIFALLILLTFTSILLLSVHTIRKRTIPIETLKDGAMRIAEGGFGHQVAISSGDEFEDLAQSFNEMSAKLQKGQAMLLQAAKMSTFGQMGAGIVHEIGQPLSAISGYAELMRAGVPPEKHRRYVEIICSQTQRLAKIISKFRIFSRSSRDMLKEIDINEILGETQDLLDHSLKMNCVQLKMEKHHQPPFILGDKDALQQVFVNLVVNAIDALEGKPEEERFICVKSYADQGHVHIAVSDNGCGITPEDRQSIFDPFFTTKSESKGTGLGLAVISSIIHKHRGKIGVESVVGQGTQFIISLPVASQ